MHDDPQRFPSVPQALVLLLANFLLQSLLWALLYDVRSAMGLSHDQTRPLVMVVGYGLILVSLMHYRRMTYRDLMHRSRSSVGSTVALLVPPVLLLVPLVLLVESTVLGLVHEWFPLSRWEEQAFRGMAAGNLPTVIAACVLAPVLEEMLFRGVLLRAFLTRHARRPAIAYSALLFGVAHLNLDQFLLAFCLGLLLGWLFERSQSLIPCMALHAGVNTSVVVLAQVSAPQNDTPSMDVGVGVWLLAVVAGLTGAWILRRVLRGPAHEAADAA